MVWIAAGIRQPKSTAKVTEARGVGGGGGDGRAPEIRDQGAVDEEAEHGGDERATSWKCRFGVEPDEGNGCSSPTHVASNADQRAARQWRDVRDPSRGN